jgi:hypothetical protein
MVSAQLAVAAVEDRDEPSADHGDLHSAVRAAALRSLRLVTMPMNGDGDRHFDRSIPGMYRRDEVGVVTHL